MTFRFGRFEFDERKRELRLGSRPIELQPRMFDLLAYLLRNHERVVSKEELFSALWPEVIVTDSSIMRAVSVIRSILREDGQENAIKTYSRQGYRFVGNLTTGSAPQSASSTPDLARAAAKNKTWQEVLQAYCSLENTDKLTTDDFEQWAHAALCLGQPNDAIYPLERAVAAHHQCDNRVAAARAALTLTNLHLEARALAVGKGWHSRAGAFLAEEKNETREHGLYLWLSARIALFEGNLEQALERAEHAEVLAKRLKDPDVEALGLIYRGHVELAFGRIREGLVHLDEAGAATLAGNVSPWASGIVFCSIIWAYLDRGDLVRAGQWTDQFTRWCERNASFGFPGLCHLHRGEVLCVKGDLSSAEVEICKARELLAKSARYAEGDACRVLGEIRLLRGDREGAEEAFRQAHELGWHPLPGWALLQAEKGQLDDAIKTLQRGMLNPSWADGQRRGILLAHLACIAAQAGDHALAKQTLVELEAATPLRDTPGCEALFQRARGEFALARQNYDEAIAAFRQALTVWLEAESKINVAHTRLRLAESLSRAGNTTEAEMELTSAENAFRKIEADRMVAHCSGLRERLLQKQTD
ncbi:MAG: winged helix-turn-helix domain-containing protein [Nibricoccus sp.]